ncbi:unnamed protein product [Rhodiola kirilowii]
MVLWIIMVFYHIYLHYEYEISVAVDPDQELTDAIRVELVEYSEQVIKLAVVLLEFLSEALALEPISRLHPCPGGANVLKPSNKAKVKDTKPIAKPTSSIFTDADIQGHCCVKDAMLSLHLLDASRKNFALSKL